MPFFRPKIERIFEETLRESLDRASALLASPSREIAHAVLATGNSSALLTAKRIMSKRALRTKLDKPKSYQLCKLFTLDALSRYLALLDDQLQNPLSEEERRKAREAWGGIIYRLFLDSREEGIRAYVNLDRQFRYDHYERQPRIEKQGGFVIYSLYDLYLLGASMTALGHGSKVDLPAGLPVQYDHLGPFETWLGGVGLGPADVVGLRVGWLGSFGLVVETLKELSDE